ncbi:MAG: hypothetical protein ACRCYO_09350 [Bacteroidia bacterium]
MLEQLHTYFKAEKSEALLFLLVGIVATGLALWFFFVIKQRFYIGIAIPLALIGLIQVVVGSNVFFRTDKQIAALEKQYNESPIAMAKSELPRMEVVMKSFTIYKWIEVAFILGGLVCLLVFHQRDFLLGLGIGLLVQGSLMLTLDIFAERRGHTYIDTLQKIN